MSFVQIMTAWDLVGRSASKWKPLSQKSLKKMKRRRRHGQISSWSDLAAKHGSPCIRGIGGLQVFQIKNSGDTAIVVIIADAVFVKLQGPESCCKSLCWNRALEEVLDDFIFLL